MNPELSQDLSLFHLIIQASVPVQLVMLLLLGASLLSWWFIFIKMFTLKRALRETDRFEREFWAGGDINVMYKRVAGQRETAGEMERIFATDLTNCVELTAAEWDGRGAHKKFTELLLAPLRPLL